jgi:membrane-associated protein
VAGEEITGATFGVSVDVMNGPFKGASVGGAGEVPMMHVDLPGLGGWVLVAVFTLVVLDALLPFMPGETVVVASGVAVAGHGWSPLILAVLATATAGVLGGDLLAYLLGGRSGPAVTRRLRRGRRGAALHDGVAALMRRHGPVLLVFGRYLPGVRSATAYTAGAVGFPIPRFITFTLLGGLLWTGQAVLLGYLGGVAFAGRPLAGLCVGWLAAALLSGAAVLAQRLLALTRSRSGSVAAEVGDGALEAGRGAAVDGVTAVVAGATVGVDGGAAVEVGGRV